MCSCDWDKGEFCVHCLGSAKWYRKHYKKASSQLIGLKHDLDAGVADKLREEIKALTEAGDLYQLDHDAEARRKSIMGLSTDKCLCHRCRKWDKAKGGTVAVPYNDGAR